MISRPLLDKDTLASHLSPLTDIWKPDVVDCQSPGKESPGYGTFGMAKLTVDPLTKGSHIFFILIEISTEAAPGEVDDSDTAALNKGISETNAHSEQESMAVTLKLLEYVEMETMVLACLAAGVLRLFTMQRTTDAVEGGARVPPVITITRSHPFDDNDAVACTAPAGNVTERSPCFPKLQKPDSRTSDVEVKSVECANVIVA